MMILCRYGILSAILAVLWLSCSPRPAFYWANYSQTAYKMKKTNGVQEREAHKKELLKIMERSKRRRLKVPPGVYCEYGYLQFQDNNIEDALKYITLEQETYPEAKVFTERLIRMISGKRRNSSSGTPSDR